MRDTFWYCWLAASYSATNKRSRSFSMYLQTMCQFHADEGRMMNTDTISSFT